MPFGEQNACQSNKGPPESRPSVASDRGRLIRRNRTAEPPAGAMHRAVASASAKRSSHQCKSMMESITFCRTSVLPIQAEPFAVYALYGIYLFFEKDGVVDWMTEHHAENIAGQMKAATPWIEDTREFFGLCITSFVLLVNYFYAKRKKQLST